MNKVKRTPRAKIIETAFGVLQAAADNCRGSSGGNERLGPEITAEHLAAAMFALNQHCLRSF